MIFMSVPGSLEKGLKWSLPVMLGYAPIGAAYGLLALQAGLSVWETVGLSVFVFAGAAQFMAVSMFSNGVSAAVIVSAVFAVNFRHVLMSASLSPFISKWSGMQRFLLGSLLTDESFALHSAHFAGGDTDAPAAITLNISGYLAWAASGFIGHKLGALIKHPEAWGLDFALPAMFIGLLMPVCARRPALLAALFGGGASLSLYLAGLGKWAVFLGAIAGATAGICVRDGKTGE
ncbi:MAG: AzlC family ABC transporter permease [Synergistaceae bacterium]|jgi:4-azaleucine resistance transporter AzlC|nr:AzlC family ABC transporter permease [Synergistaceae bacterium]